MNNLKLKYKLAIAYIFIGVLFGTYGWLFGDNAYKGLAYNLGTGLVWPAIIFPEFGKLIGGIVTVAIVLALTVLR